MSLHKLQKSLFILGCLASLFCLVSFLYYWDPTRIYAMELRGRNDFAYAPLPEKFLAFDPASNSKIHKNADILPIRQALPPLLLGIQDVTDAQLDHQSIIYQNDHKIDLAQTGLNQPDCAALAEAEIAMACELENYKNWPELKEMQLFQTYLGQKTKLSSFWFRNRQPNHKLILYHHGYASTFHENAVLLKRLMEQGYDILAFNFAGYGDSRIHDQQWTHVYFGRYGETAYPFKLFLQLVFASLNEASTKESYQEISMIGLSAGAWVTSLSAAIDPRIEKSFPVAGVMPIQLRIGDKEAAAPQFFAPLLNQASYIDLFQMAVDQPERQQIQIFNRYDRCCYNNIRGKIYEDFIQDKSLGDFEVIMDESHASHKISRFAFEKILTHLKGDASHD